VNAEAAAVEQPISKSEFARRRRVSPGRVTQWITAGKLDGAALRDGGVVESVAVEQLRLRLNVNQRFGNGLLTNLAPPAAADQAPAPETDNVVPLPVRKAPSPQDELADQIQREKLEQLQRQNREGARKEAAAAGVLTDAEAAQREMGRCAAQMIAVFEGGLSELATAIAAQFKLPQRDVLHLMRGEMRGIRAKAADVLRRQGEAMPELVPHDVDADAEVEPELETTE
jgi:hypothetical protein